MLIRVKSVHGNDLPAKSTRLMVDCIDVFSLLLFCVKVTDTIVCARLLNSSQHSPIKCNNNTVFSTVTPHIV